MNRIYSIAPACLGIAACAALFAVSGPASAGSSMINVEVAAKLQSSCQIVTSPGLAFPEVATTETGLVASPIVATTTIGSRCSIGTNYRVLLGDGLGRLPAGGNRRMRNVGATANLEYQLYRDAAHTQIWDGTVSSGARIGNGAAQSQTVYGRIPVNAAVPAVGAYSDTIVITLEYEL